MSSDDGEVPTAPPAPWTEVHLDTLVGSGSPGSASPMYEHQYVLGLSLLLLLIFIGLSAAIFMCLTIRREPMLWSRTFGGLLHKTEASRCAPHVPRRVRFNVPASGRDLESTGSAITVIVAAAEEGNEPYD